MQDITDRVVDSKNFLFLADCCAATRLYGRGNQRGDLEAAELGIVLPRNNIEGCVVCFGFDRSMLMKPKNWCTFKAQKTHL